MPRVTHVKKAQKDNPVCKKGESYYWWKFRYGGKRYSLTRPKASQLTQSAYYGSLYEVEERIAEEACGTAEEMEALRDEISEEIRNIGQECQDSLDNMPDSLQQGPTGELLQERIDACDGAADEIESIDIDIEFEAEEMDDDPEWDETEREEAIENHRAEEEEREANELIDWLDEKRTEMTEAIGNCHV